MRVPKHELISLGLERIEGRSSSKQAVEAYRPLPMRGLNSDWPMMVFESGLSESLNRLGTGGLSNQEVKSRLRFLFP